VRQPSVAEHLRRIATALQELGVRWYVFGAQAVIAAGAVRTTADIDITTEDVSPVALRRALEKAGFVLRRDVEDIDELIEHHRILPMEHTPSGMQLDVVRAGPGPEEQMLERVIYRKVGRSRVPFVSTNDLLVLKVLAARAKDLEDVRVLLRTGTPEIDPVIVRSRLAELGALIDDSSLVATFDALVGEATPTKAPVRRRSPRRRR
jgi:hypothetical protein